MKRLSAGDMLCGAEGKRRPVFVWCIKPVCDCGLDAVSSCAGHNGLSPLPQGSEHVKECLELIPASFAHGRGDTQEDTLAPLRGPGYPSEIDCGLHSDRAGSRTSRSAYRQIRNVHGRFGATVRLAATAQGKAGRNGEHGRLLDSDLEYARAQSMAL